MIAARLSFGVDGMLGFDGLDGSDGVDGLDGAGLLLEDIPKRLELCAEAAGATDKDSAAMVADETSAVRNLFIPFRIAITDSFRPVYGQFSYSTFQQRRTYDRLLIQRQW